jgi:tetratricopeptide (TPR) repeat protein
MRSISLSAARVTGLFTVAMIITIASSALAQNPQYGDRNRGQEPDKSTGPQLSDGERQAINKIKTAADNNARIQAAAEFIKKYPKSTMRGQVVGYVASEVAKVEDSTQQITLGESFLTAFKEPADISQVNRILVDAYVKAKRPDDAFRVGAAELTHSPNDVPLLTQLALVGSDQVKARNSKFVSQSQQYANKAIELIEGDKKPDGLDAAQWTEYKTKWLGALYQSLGIISFVAGSKDEARIKLEKASSLNGSDPVAYMLLGSIVNEEYEQLARQHQTTAAGPLKDELLGKAHTKMDQVIELFARAVGLSEGRPDYQQLHDQILQSLQDYYKYRHNGSVNGLQQLVDKYKPTAKSP